MMMAVMMMAVMKMAIMMAIMMMAIMMMAIMMTAMTEVKIKKEPFQQRHQGRCFSPPLRCSKNHISSNTGIRFWLLLIVV